MTHGTCFGTFWALHCPRLAVLADLKRVRPETVESLFTAFRLTGDQRYRDQGWAIFQAIEKHCRIPSGGYATIVNVDEVPVQHEDKMETFFLVLFEDLATLVIKKPDVVYFVGRNIEVPISAILRWRHDPTLA
jgi:Glycosyl hydrolase family 47